MKVFISWSGDKSRDVALVLRDWLPGVINNIEPFVSSKDIDAGTRWQNELAAQLEATNFGIVCVTTQNQLTPWLNFEAGALAKAVDSTRVVPLAIDLKPSDVKPPLGQFQAQPATETGIRAIVESINAASSDPLSESLLNRSLTKWWPDLAIDLEKIDAASAAGPSSASPDRSERELLEEVLNTVRSLSRSQVGSPKIVKGAAGVLEIGMKVMHAEFGPGVVVGTEAGGIVLIHFSRDGSNRKLMAEYAPLERLPNDADLHESQ